MPKAMGRNFRKESGWCGINDGSLMLKNNKNNITSKPVN